MQVWVCSLQLPPVLLLCPCIQGSQMNRLRIRAPFQEGLPQSRQKFKQYQLQSRLFRGARKVYRSRYRTNFILWAYLKRYNVYLGIDTDSWLKNYFGDEWLEHETRGKREHEIDFLPTRSQVVPITEPLCQKYSWRTQVSTCWDFRLC